MWRFIGEESENSSKKKKKRNLIFFSSHVVNTIECIRFMTQANNVCEYWIHPFTIKVELSYLNESETIRSAAVNSYWWIGFVGSFPANDSYWHGSLTERETYTEKETCRLNDSVNKSSEWLFLLNDSVHLKELVCPSPHPTSVMWPGVHRTTKDTVPHSPRFLTRRTCELTLRAHLHILNSLQTLSSVSAIFFQPVIFFFFFFILSAEHSPDPPFTSHE